MKSLRNQLHLTQYELAALIGVSRSTITLYEKGRRNLPTKATIKLAAIQLLLQTGQEKKQSGIRLLNRQQLQCIKVEKQLDAHARKAAADALQVSMMLSKMQQAYQQLSKKMGMIQLLMQEATPATRHMSLLENLEQHVLDAMEHCAPARQMVAEYKLAMLNARQQAALSVKTLVQQSRQAVKDS